MLRYLRPCIMTLAWALFGAAYLRASPEGRTCRW